MNVDSSSDEEFNYENFKKFLYTYFQTKNDLNNTDIDSNYINFKKFYKYRKDFYKNYPQKDNKLLYDQIFNYVIDIFNNVADKVLDESENPRNGENISSTCQTKNINIQDIDVDYDATLPNYNIGGVQSSEQDNSFIINELIIEEDAEGAEQSTKEFLKNFPGFLNFIHVENDNFDEVVDSSIFAISENNVELLGKPETITQDRTKIQNQKSVRKSFRTLGNQMLRSEIALVLKDKEVTNNFDGHFNNLFKNVESLHSKLQQKNINHLHASGKLVLPNYLKFIENIKIPTFKLPISKISEIWKHYKDVEKPNYLDQDLTVYICKYVNSVAVLPPFENNMRDQSIRTLNSIAEVPFTSRDLSSIQDIRDSREEYQSRPKNLSGINPVINITLPFTKSTPIVNKSLINQSNIVTPTQPTISTEHARGLIGESTPFPDQLSRNLLELPEDIAEMSDILMTDQTIEKPSELPQQELQNDFVNQSPQLVAQDEPISLNELCINPQSNDIVMKDLSVEKISELPRTPIESNTNQIITENLEIQQEIHTGPDVQNENIPFNSETVETANNDSLILISNILNADDYRRNWYEVLRTRDDIKYYDSNETPNRRLKRRKQKKKTNDPIVVLPENESVIPADVVLNEPTMIEQIVPLQENVTIPEVFDELINQNFENINELPNIFLNWKNDILEAAHHEQALSEPKLMSDIQKLEEEYFLLGTNVSEILNSALQKPFVKITELNPPETSRKLAALRFNLLLELNGKLIDLHNTDNTVLGYSMINL